MLPPPTRGAADGAEPGAGAARALWLLRQLANGYRLLCQFKCQEAVASFQVRLGLGVGSGLESPCCDEP